MGTAVCTAIIAVLGIVSKIYLLPMFGIDILPIINVISFALVLFINYILVVRVGDGQCFQLNFIIPIALVVSFATFVCPYLYSNNFIRYALCLIGVVASFAVLIKTKSFWLGFIKKKLKFRK